MIQFAYLALAGLIATVILNYTKGLQIESVYPIMLGVSFVIFSIWGGCIIAEIQSMVKNQLQDFHSIKKLKESKVSYQAEMDSYTKEMKTELLEKYREFEETLMKQVSDSKIIATILKQSGYSTVLTNYNNQIRNYLSKIHECDRSIQSSIMNMQVRQDDTFYSYAKFLPKNIRWTG